MGKKYNKLPLLTGLKDHNRKDSMSFGQKVNWLNVIWPKDNWLNVIWLEGNWLNIIWPKVNWLNIIWPKVI